MTRKQTMTLITLGVVLSVSHVVGIPLAWKEWMSVLVALFLLGWGLVARYAPRSKTNVVHDVERV